MQKLDILERIEDAKDRLHLTVDQAALLRDAKAEIQRIEEAHQYQRTVAKEMLRQAEKFSRVTAQLAKALEDLYDKEKLDDDIRLPGYGKPLKSGMARAAANGGSAHE